jgi:hypothetical protein
MPGMDVRRKTFAREVASAFSALTDRGFGVPTFRDETLDRTVLLAEYRSPHAVVEVSLVLGPAGEDEVATTLQGVDGRRVLGPDTAHTGYQMRKALASQSSALLLLLV